MSDPDSSDDEIEPQLDLELADFEPLELLGPAAVVGLNVQVLEVRLPVVSLVDIAGLVLEFQNISVSLIVFTESGDRVMLPGVMCGSSSTFFIWDPFQGLPGSNSGTRSERL